ncbi:C-C motif chemokine 19-like [Pristis pectinata]|uniref:C-C motif chemokine 19-like n=1 Tax=Pristis pectinata TaxID=685728 RepID=UPI00223E21C8|nr:C-C motif chemokine 19-like [Pristis pectinata]
MTLHIQYALLICAALFQLSEGGRGDDGATDCCLDVSNRVIPRRIVAGYKLQGNASGCRIPAVIFITIKDRKLCAPHNVQWVKRLMRWCDKVKSSSGK